MPFLRTRWWCSFLLLASLAACREDPNNPQFWAKELKEAKRAQDRVRILDDLRKSEHLSKSMLPMLHEQLATQKVPEVRSSIARILAQLKDPSSVDPLVEAVDVGSTSSGTDRMNREIASALGDLGDPKAVPVLLKLLSGRDPFVQLQAAESLGKLRAKAAVRPLLSLAQDDSKEALVANKAIAALGEIGDPSIIPQLIKLMFAQRGPTSLYEPAAFALYKLGKPAADALLPVLAGTDAELWRWAKQHDIAPAALYSKSAQTLGYLLESRAEPLLLQRLSFKADDETQQGYVRLTAADSLGRLRAEAAIKPLIGLLDEEELMVRGAYLHALGRIGSRDAVPALVQAAGKGIWEQRSPVLEALSLVGDGREVAAVEQLQQAEAEHVKEECAATEGQASLCKKPEELTNRRVEIYRQRIAVLKAAEKCQEQIPCWTQALEDGSASVRTRAALVLGRSGQAASLGPILKRMADPDRDARLALLLAADWLTQNAEALKAARASLADLEAQLAKDEGRSDWVETSDNLRRLITKLKRGS